MAVKQGLGRWEKNGVTEVVEVASDTKMIWLREEHL
jgi:hypothetical protein